MFVMLTSLGVCLQMEQLLAYMIGSIAFIAVLLCAYLVIKIYQKQGR